MAATHSPHVVALLYEAYLRLQDVVLEAGRAYDAGIRPAHSAVFFHMEHGGIRLSRLAEKAQMTAQAMGALVDDLENLGYLRRVPDPADRRAKLIIFTERGDEALKIGYTAIDEVERRLAALLGEDGLAELNATLSRVIRQF
ncbi:MarR family winged helix-turn-helix transcriptional regulator [Nonomuraea basaltis]|uniref:MarR family winged helix-turn-helix transcriptional regulator n=1 Tax=Nonomuraea basaltis TaxID=2495887 RepID=UPI00110C6797|nr:MarR family transcriptional regulator [Nonomuraea basaltis]TMR96394.1 MarR family transcriptional regulator [Nonomuraea basaltis]